MRFTTVVPVIFGCWSAPASFPTSAHAQVFVDDFDDDHVDPHAWSIEVYGSGAQIAEQNQQLEFFMPAKASGDEFGVRLVSVFALRGDFDIQVDFGLLDWPMHNGVRTAVGLTDDLYDDYGMERSSLSATEPLGAQEVYIADFGPYILIPTKDLAGKLRLVRSGSEQTGYYFDNGTWIPVLTDGAPTEDITIQLHAWSHDWAFRDADVSAAFDNFTVTSGELVWPPTPTRVSTWGQIKATFGR